MAYLYRIKRTKPDGSIQYATGGILGFTDSIKRAKLWKAPGYLKAHFKQYTSSVLSSTTINNLFSQLQIEQLEFNPIHTFLIEEFETYHE